MELFLFTVYVFFIKFSFILCSDFNLDCDEIPPGILLPHPYDCSLFLHCQDGVVTIGFCPVNMFFNPDIGQCDFEENCQEPITTTQDPNVEDGIECPQTNGFTFIPSNIECDLYYMCLNGIGPIPHRCLPGLHWNQIIGKCDFIEQANCPVSIVTVFLMIIS